MWRKLKWHCNFTGVHDRKPFSIPFALMWSTKKKERRNQSGRCDWVLVVRIGKHTYWSSSLINVGWALKESKQNTKSTSFCIHFKLYKRTHSVDLRLNHKVGERHEDRAKMENSSCWHIEHLYFYSWRGQSRIILHSRLFVYHKCDGLTHFWSERF